jgi:hypothetical protein
MAPDFLRIVFENMNARSNFSGLALQTNSHGAYQRLLRRYGHSQHGIG